MVRPDRTYTRKVEAQAQAYVMDIVVESNRTEFIYVEYPM